jgi:hypothetical protein
VARRFEFKVVVAQVTEHVLAPRERSRRHMRAASLLLQTLQCLESCRLDIIVGMKSETVSQWSGVAACMEQRGVRPQVRLTTEMACHSQLFGRFSVVKVLTLTAVVDSPKDMANSVLAGARLHAGGISGGVVVLHLHCPPVPRGCL